MKPPFHVAKKEMEDSRKLADELLEHAGKVAKALQEQREEILSAFVAKYGFDPDECEQVYQGNSWFVVRLAPDRVARIQREIILARLHCKNFTKWQSFCLWLAGIK